MLTVNIVLDYSTGYSVNHFFHWQTLFIYMAILIYYLGFRGYQVSDNQLFSLLQNQQKQASSPARIRGKRESDKTGLLPEAEQTVTIRKEDRSTDLKYKAAGEAILKLMSEERLYLDPELSLQTLAQKLKLSPVVTSTVINFELKKNFRNLINEYRVKEVKLRLNDPHSSQLSLLGIAYECGFNSEASFYRIFKNIVGLSPKEYLTCQQKG
ncbi:MAG: AraC family transcriptional regulator [Chitinophagaceae bacterium]